MFAAPAFGGVNGVLLVRQKVLRHVDRSACSDFAIRILDAAVRRRHGRVHATGGTACRAAERTAMLTHHTAIAQDAQQR